MRVFIYLSFDGTAYHGWQIQPNAISVQQRLAEAAGMLLRQPTDIVGAGRTDAGVHAHMMVAHCDVPEGTDLPLLTHKLNRVLPPDIAVSRIVRVVPGAHARFDALSRTYHYRLYTCKNPFLGHYATRITYPLDFDKMNEAAAWLLQVDDFGAFCKANTDVKTTLCDVMEARWIACGDHEWYFRISANRFLRNMVRAVVGTLIEVGRGRMTLEQFRAVVAGKCRSDAGESMPGNALFLENVEY